MGWLEDLSIVVEKNKLGEDKNSLISGFLSGYITCRPLPLKISLEEISKQTNKKKRRK